MIKKRDLAICIILSLVTCGIYGLYWFYCLHNDTDTVAGKTDDVSAVLAIVLTLVTCGIYGYYWMYTRGKLLHTAHQSRGLQSDDKSVLYLVLAVIGLSIVSYALMQNELNNLAEMN